MGDKHRHHPWLYEQDGDLNPTWVLVVLYSVIGLAVAVFAAAAGGDIAKTAALSFIGAALMALLISALPRDKAKILAKSRLPGQVAHGIAETAAREFGGSTQGFDADDYTSGSVV